MSEEKALYPARRDDEPRERISPHKAGLLHVQVPLRLLALKEVSAGAKLCYGRLALHANAKTYCWPGQEALAEELGVTVRQVCRYTTELQTHGLIETENRAMGQTQRYHFLRHEWMSDRSDISVRSDRTDMSSIKDQGKSDDDEEEERPNYLAELEALYLNLPMGLSSPLYAPSKWFATLRKNGSKLIEADLQECVEFALAIGTSLWGRIGYPETDRPIAFVKPEVLPKLEEAAVLWRKYPRANIFFLKTQLQDFAVSQGEDIPRIQPTNILMLIIDHLDAFETVLRNPGHDFLAAEEAAP